MFFLADFPFSFQKTFVKRRQDGRSPASPYHAIPLKEPSARLTLRFPEFGAVDSDRMTIMPESAQEGIYHVRIAQEIRPFVI
jgi:hypothetical protein